MVSKFFNRGLALLNRFLDPKGYAWFRNETHASGKGDFPFEGRFCVNIGNDEIFRFSYTLGELRTSFGVTCSPDEARIGVRFCVPGLSLFVSSSSWERYGKTTKAIGHKTLDLSVHDGHIWYTTPFADPDIHRTEDPWYYRGAIDLEELLLGKESFSREQMSQPIAVTIPMPEGSYAGVYTAEKLTWDRPRWFSKSRVMTTIRCDEGVPIQGKGENDYDIDQDAIYAHHSEDASNPAQAVGQFVASALQQRWRYGGLDWKPEPRDPDSSPNTPSNTIPAPVMAQSSVALPN